MSIENNPDNTKFVADFIIIGGGTAANTLARLLTNENKFSVIVIEAGANNSLAEPIRDSKFTQIQFGLEQNFYPEYFWQHASVQDGSLVNANYDNSIKVNCNRVVAPHIEQHEQNINYDEKHGDEGHSESHSESHGGGQYTTGRLLGGGSSINGQQWVRGSVGYWSEIEKATNCIWSPRNVIKRFIKLEKYFGITTNEHARGKKGYVSVRQTPHEPTDMAQKFATAVENATGLEEIIDYNDPKTPVGSFTRWQLTQKHNGSRESSDTAFLFPNGIDQDGNGIDCRSLKVFFQTTAMKILFDGNKAVGVLALRGNPLQCLTLKARYEVIVSAGVYSAEILQKSGIGSIPLLKCLNIPVVAENNFIGHNMQNHLVLTVTFSANPEDMGVPQEDPYSLYTGGAFLPALTKGIKSNLRGYQLIGASPAPGTFIILLISLQPISRGLVKIQSSDPLTISLADQNSLGDKIDIEQFKEAIRTYIVPIAEELNKIDPTYKLLSPTMEVIEDDHLLSHFVENTVVHSHHWVGTNSMHIDPKKGAVDPSGQVYGTKGLRVADCSVLPLISDGNTQGPAYVVGWTIAELLIEKYCK